MNWFPGTAFSKAFYFLYTLAIQGFQFVIYSSITFIQLLPVITYTVYNIIALRAMLLEQL